MAATKVKHERPGGRTRPDAPRDVVIAFRVAPDEAEAIRQAAAASGASLSNYCRGTAIASITHDHANPSNAGGAAT